MIGSILAKANLILKDIQMDSDVAKTSWKIVSNIYDFFEILGFEKLFAYSSNLDIE